MAQTHDPVTLEEVLRLARRLSPVDKVRLIERVAPEVERALAARQGDGNRSVFGRLKDVGPAPSAEEIDAARHEAWSSFPHDDERHMWDDTTTQIEQYYDAEAAREAVRLDRHRIEYAITRRALREHLPTPPAKIADVGSGPGRYAVALAGEGYHVTLVDLSAPMLALAREVAATAGVEFSAYIHANALDLSALSGQSFDAVLLLGPLYHLLSLKDRERALIESRRLLRGGGLIFAAFITRYSPFRDAARRDPMAVIREPELLRTVLTTGQHHSSSNGRFTHAYFAHPSEITPLMEASGFTSLGLLACEGIVSGIDEQVNRLEGDAWDIWVDLNYQLAPDPSTHGSAYHLLYVGQKSE